MKCELAQTCRHANYTFFPFLFVKKQPQHNSFVACLCLVWVFFNGLAVDIMHSIYEDSSKAECSCIASLFLLINGSIIINGEWTANLLIFLSPVATRSTASHYKYIAIQNQTSLEWLIRRLWSKMRSKSREELYMLMLLSSVWLAAFRPVCVRIVVIGEMDRVSCRGIMASDIAVHALRAH